MIDGNDKCRNSKHTGESKGKPSLGQARTARQSVKSDDDDDDDTDIGTLT